MSAAGEHALIVRSRLRTLVTVDQPLVLISQMPRSGGTLLLRLLDGHPACHTFPLELGSIFPSGHKLVRGAENAWATLEDQKLERIMRQGHTQAMQKLSGDRSVYPLVIPPLLQQEMFTELYEALEEPTPRAALDAFMTSYFNAWLDNRNLHGPVPKRWVVGFSPNAILRQAKREHYDELYPDGRVISIIRDPRTWFASARRWSQRWADRDVAVAAWCETARAACDWKRAKGERMLILSFDRLLRETEEVVREVAAFLDIEPTPEMLSPTINGLPALANSSFAVSGPVVSTDPLAHREDLGAAEAAAGELYAEVEALASPAGGRQ